MLYRPLKKERPQKPPKLASNKPITPKKKRRPTVKVFKKMFQYDLLERTPNKILFEVLENGQPIGFEVFKISIRNLKEIWKRLGTRKVDVSLCKPDYHTYMNSQLFGDNGWYFKKLADAMKKYGMLK